MSQNTGILALDSHLEWKVLFPGAVRVELRNNICRSDGIPSLFVKLLVLNFHNKQEPELVYYKICKEDQLSFNFFFFTNFVGF